MLLELEQSWSKAVRDTSPQRGPVVLSVHSLENELAFASKLEGVDILYIVGSPRVRSSGFVEAGSVQSSLLAPTVEDLSDNINRALRDRNYDLPALTVLCGDWTK